MSLFFTKCLLHTPPSPKKAVIKCRVVYPKLICPTEERLSFSLECQNLFRWFWRRAKCFFDRPPCSKSLVKTTRVKAEQGSPFGNRHLFPVIFQLFSLSWWKQKIISAPVCIDTIRKRARSNSRFFSPIAKALTVVTNCNPPSPASVPCLLPMCFPATVIRFVISIIVDPPYGCFGKRLQPHVAQERRKRVLPSVTDAYPSSAIVHIAGLVLVVASALHGAPSRVFWASCSTMSCVAKNGLFPPSASARQSTFQVTRRNIPSSATRTFAQPCRLSAVGSNPSILQYGPLSVFVTSQIFNLARNSNRIIRSHMTVPRILDVVRATQRVMTVGLLAFYRICFAEPSGKWR